MQNLIFIATFRGLGQIMLQENALTGLVFLAGIFYGSIEMGAAALLASFVGTVTAYTFRFDEKEIEQGLYGFSAALVGVAIMLLLQPVFVSWLIVIAGSAVAAIVQHFFIKRNIPVFTFPFVLVTWAIVLTVGYFSGDLFAKTTPLIASETDKYLFAFKGYGQVIFQAGLFSGILFFAGVFINSPVSAIYGLIGAAISGSLAYGFTSVNEIANGLLSYNAVLCAIVFAGRKFENLSWALTSVILSLLFSLLMLKFQLLALTFPFVLAACLTLLLKDRLTIKSA